MEVATQTRTPVISPEIAAAAQALAGRPTPEQVEADRAAVEARQREYLQMRVAVVHHGLSKRQRLLNAAASAVPPALVGLGLAVLYREWKGGK